MLEKDHANLLAIIDAAKKILRYSEDHFDADSFYQDERTFDAVLMNFILIGETVSKLSDEFKNANDNIHWQQIKGFRNIIAHDYFGVDAEEVWQIIQEHISILIDDIENLLPS